MSLQRLLADQLGGLEPRLCAVLTTVLEEVDRQREEVLKREDFSALKALVERNGAQVADLLDSGRRFDARMDRLAATQAAALAERDARWEAERKEQAAALAERDARWEAERKEREAREARIDARLDRLAAAQERTEKTLVAMQESQGRMQESQARMQTSLIELQESQGRMQTSLIELQESQGRMQESLVEMQRAITSLTHEGQGMRRHLGGLSRSVSYALENDAYRLLPSILAKEHGIEVTERLVRATVGGREINLLAHGRRNGDAVLVVGESELRLDDDGKFAQLRQHLAVVGRQYAEPLVPVLITHYAAPRQLETARKHGVLVVQSFEWA